MSEKKETEDYASEEANQTESFDVNKSGTSETYDMKDFCPGIRIEAKDFDGKWYPAKVSDVDWTENEILVHFENWNTKFDEWIPMDSSRLRPIQKPVMQQKDAVKFSKGEEVMAMWSPYQKYPATIQAVLANDRYDVLFYDGFLKRLKGHKISKLEGGTIKSEVRNFTDIGTKEERRERKRKINVAELFHINKRSRKKGLVHSKSQDIKTYPVTKSRIKTSLKKPISLEENAETSTSADPIHVKPPEEKVLTSTVSTTNKPTIDALPATFEVKYLNGETETWSKKLYQRSEGRTAGKLDIVIQNPQGRKFRSRNEIMKYCEENGIVYSHEAFDFSAKGRPKSKPVIQTPPVKPEILTEDKDKSLKKVPRKSTQDVPITSQTVGNILPVSTDVLSQDNIPENKVFIGDFEVVIENGKFICPVKVCAKHFRRENLLHMHMKHYHPEFSKYLDYTPSVTDLAYARTVGSLDGVEVQSPAPRKVASTEKSEKSTVKTEAIRKTSESNQESVKETKKLKTADGRSHPIKPLSDPSPINVVPQVEDLNEDNQKNKSNTSNLQLSRSNLPSNENETVNSETKVNNLGSSSSEPRAPESEDLVATHNVIKSVRHHRLHGRKKTSRFQGSFVEQMRKKRLISQGHSKSHSRMGRQQQSQHLRQQLQQAQPSQTTISSHSLVEDTNSNTSSQAYTMARYPKPHLNLPNEISGKNSLLISSKTLSPVSKNTKRKRKHSSEKTENLTEGNGSSLIETVDCVNEYDNTREYEDDHNDDDDGDDADDDDDDEYDDYIDYDVDNYDEDAEDEVEETKRNNPSVGSRRSFLAGLLNARKRKGKAIRNRLREKKSERNRSTLEASGFGWMFKENQSGRIQCKEKPDDNEEGYRSPNEDSASVNNTGNEDRRLVSDSLDDLEYTRNKKAKRKKVSNRKRSIKLRIKPFGVKSSHIENAGSPSSTEPNVFEEPSQETGEIIAKENADNDRLEVMNAFVDESSKKMNEITIPVTNNADDKDVKTDLKDLSKSYMENVYRKEVHSKLGNGSNKGNDENVQNDEYRDAVVMEEEEEEYFEEGYGEEEENGSSRQRSSKKRKRSRKSSNRNKDRRQVSRKRVRFENTVMEKWISVDEGEEFVNNSSPGDTMDALRREDRKKRLTKYDLVNYLKEKDVNQQKRMEDCSRDEISFPNIKISGLDQAEGTEDSKSPLAIEHDKVEKLRRNEIINCICGITEEDGLMIQCDLCLCWQHGHCANILRELDVPDKYTCSICKNPYRARSSMKYLHDQEWLKEGTLPSLSFRSKRDDIINQRRTILKRSHDLSGSIALLAQVVHSLRVKVNIAEKKDHPKLWLWAKKWTEKKPNRLKEESDIKEERTEEQNVELGGGIKTESGLNEDEKHLPKAPEPEAPIDSAECRLNLLDHLIHYQTLIDARLSCIESLVAELESMQDDAVNDETPERYPRTKATVQMLLRDLNTMKKIATI